jgi:hypothetical protein
MDHILDPGSPGAPGQMRSAENPSAEAVMNGPQPTM